MNEKIIIANAVTGLNGLPESNGAKWYVSESALSSTAISDGRLRRVELWLLTDEAAQEAELI